MLKTMGNKSLGINYFFVPDNKDNLILTSDGVLVNYDTFKMLSKKEYEELKKQNSSQLYSYEKSKNQGRLILKDNAEISLEKLLETNREDNKVEEMQEFVAEKEIKKPTEKSRKVSNKKVFKKKFNFFKSVFNVERFIMLLISIFTIILSIYYTYSYLLKTNPPLIAMILSISMLLFSLIGVQLISVFWKKKNYLISILLAFTSLTTIVFSIYTSLEVNMARYLEDTKVVEVEKAKTSTDNLLLESLQRQMTENRKQVEITTSDMEYYKSRGLNTFSQREILDRLNAEYKEMSEKEMEILSGNVEVVIDKQSENSYSTASSLAEVVSNAIGINRDTFQMIITIFASCFIDLISPIALFIFAYNWKDPKKRKGSKI